MLLITFVLIFILWSMKLNMEKEKIYAISIISFLLICYLTNEIFSIFNTLDYKHLVTFYICFILIMFAYVIFKFARCNLIDRISKINVGIILRDNKILLGFFVIWIGMLILAYNIVPYNWDSMTYHLPRIAHWAQNKSVAHYATSDVRQVSSPVLAEFINLQVYILHKNKDILFNMLQLACYATNTVYVYFITNKLLGRGKNKSLSFLSMLVFMSMPIAFSEALTTQVDHLCTMLLLIFVYLLLDLLDDDYKLCLSRECFGDVFLLSSCIGLGYLAKPSIMFAIVVFAIWLLIKTILRKDDMKQTCILIVIAAISIVLIIAPEVGRNMYTFNSFSTSNVGARQLIGTLNPIYMFVNALKNYTMNLPNIYVDLGPIAEYGVYWISYILGVEINHVSIAEDGVEFRLHSAQRYGSDTAINPVIVICATIIVIWLVICLIKRRQVKKKIEYCLYACISFGVCCLLIRWEPFVTRYMLSYLTLLCPMVGIWVSEFKKKEIKIIIPTILVFVCCMELIDLFGFHRNILDRQIACGDNRNVKYCIGNNSVADYAFLNETFNQLTFKSLGLYTGGNCFEYPIWGMCDENIQIEYIGIQNGTAKYVDESFKPDIILVVDADSENIKEYNGCQYMHYENVGENMSIWIQN